MKIILLSIFLGILGCYSAIAQENCEEMIIWLTYFEQGKAELRTKDSEYMKCIDKYGNIVKEREFGQGRELQYAENTYNDQKKLIKAYYRHGYEGNDGGEGTITYQYLPNDKTIIDYVAANFTAKTEQKIAKNAKGLIVRQEEKETSRSEVLEDYNFSSETITTFQYTPTDSLLSKKTTIKANGTTRQTVELYRYEGKLKVRYERWETEGEKKQYHTVTHYRYNAEKLLIEEKLIDLPAQLTKSVITVSYQGGKIASVEKTDYKDFSKNERSYYELKKLGYDAKGELSHISLQTQYFYEGAFANFIETSIEQEGDRKTISVLSYNSKETRKTKSIELFQGGKLMKTEGYENEKLTYFYEYEYTKK